MIVLDTNVISETWKPMPDARVLDWIDNQTVETLYLSAITVAELRFGIAAMPSGRKRTLLDHRLEQKVLPMFVGRILLFDLDSSRAYASLMSRAKMSGRAIGKADGYIAATAMARNFAIATRDVSPFNATDLNVINPWQAD